MKILCTHPGRHGDCLWALPTLRALSRTHGMSIDLLLGPRYSDEHFCRLLRHQVYIVEVIVANDWAILETAPTTPREPPSVPCGYDCISYLGYQDWPMKSLPYEIYRIAGEQAPIDWPIDLDTPWLTAPYTLPTYQIAVGFSDEHFELKFGLYWLLREHFLTAENFTEQVIVNVSGGPRWCTESCSGRMNWEGAAAFIATAKVFVGCCSALHVLACALGTRVVLIEPAQARWHDVFYPYGKGSHGQVTLVLGGDGQPTFDSRHAIDAITAALDHDPVLP